MEKLGQYLTGLLGLQLLVVALISGRQFYMPEHTADALALSFDAVTIDRVVISDQERSSVLIRVGDHWQLDTAYPVPADKPRVAAVLDSLSDLRTTWPVASTPGSHSRFEVGENSFQKRVQLYAGEELSADLFVGTSPGFRKVHVRSADRDEVYAVTLNTYDLPSDDDRWLDKTVLAFTEVTAIEGPDYSLVRQGAQWRLQSPAASSEATEPPLDETRVKQLLDALNTFVVSGLAEADLTLPQPETTLWVTGAGDQKHRLNLYQAADNLYATRDDVAGVFTVRQYDYDQLAGKSLADLQPVENKAAADLEVE